MLLARPGAVQGLSQAVGRCADMLPPRTRVHILGAPAPDDASCTTPTSAATTPSTACARLPGASGAPAGAAAASAGAKQRSTSGCSRARQLGSGGSACGQQGSARHACGCDYSHNSITVYRISSASPQQAHVPRMKASASSGAACNPLVPFAFAANSIIRCSSQ